MKKRNYLCTLLLAASLSASSVVPAAAAQNGPGYEEQEDGYPGQTGKEGLKDNVLEYAELQDMIRAYNPTLTVATKSYDSTIQQYEDAWSELKFYQRSISTDKDEAKDSGNMEQYTYYKSQENTYKSFSGNHTSAVQGTVGNLRFFCLAVNFFTSVHKHTNNAADHNGCVQINRKVETNCKRHYRNS